MQRPLRNGQRDVRRLVLGLRIKVVEPFGIHQSNLASGRQFDQSLIFEVRKCP
jgi:hypothetical protein